LFLLGVFCWKLSSLWDYKTLNSKSISFATLEQIKKRVEDHHQNPSNQALFSIPKLIHQTYIDRNIPNQWKDTMESCKSMNPTYEFLFWTDKSMREFIQTEYSWFLPVYDGYPYAIQRVDSFRYFVLHHYGG